MIKEIVECPKNEKIKINSKACKSCEYYKIRTWYSYNKPVKIFCSFYLTDQEKQYLK